MQISKLKAMAVAVSTAGILVACGQVEEPGPIPVPSDDVVVSPTAAPSQQPQPSAQPSPSQQPLPSVQPSPSQQPSPSVQPEPSASVPPSPTRLPFPSTTPFPSVTPTNPAIWCPTADNFDPSKAYQGGDRVILGGNVYEATGWAETAPIPGAETNWENPWRLVGAVSANWCEGKAIDAKGNELPMGNWGNFPMVRRFQAYDVMANNLMVGTYYPEWGIYGRGFEAHHIPFDALTHIYYAFAPVCGDNSTSFNEAAANGNFGATNRGAFCQREFEINIYDDWAATEKSFEGDSYATPLKGLFGQFTRAKVAHPHIRVQMSVGGWTLSRPFFEMADDPAKRAIFVSSVGRFLSEFVTTFDGIDIDWEFPGAGGNDPDMGCATKDAWCYIPETYEARKRDADNFADLMIELRAELDRLGVTYGKHFELGAAVSPDPIRAADYINWDRAAPAMDFINVMTYDYAGGWNRDSLGYNTSMRYPSSGNPTWNTEGTIRRMLEFGVPAHKLVVGVAKYGRGWEGVEDWVGDDKFTGRATRNFPDDLQECQDTGCRTVDYSGPNPVGKVGAWELNIADYAYIEQEMMGGPDGTGINGWVFRYDPYFGGAYVWHEGRGALLGFDSKETVMDKGRFVKELGLGGLFSWEITGDSGTITNAMNEALGKPRR